MIEFLFMEEGQEAHFQSLSEEGHCDDDQIQNQGSLADWDNRNIINNNGNTKKDDEDSRKRLCIKFKITASKVNNYQNGAEKVCNICNKTFGSGKALGGHMRVHALSSKKVVHEAKRKSSNTNSDSITCDLCKRCFPSKKSLFGHMKSHSERIFRGIQPPKSPNPTFDSILSKGWSMVAKRGRKSLLSSCCNKIGSEPLEHDDIMQHMEELEAANGLMFLAHGNPETKLEYEEDECGISCDPVEFSPPLVSFSPIKKLKIEDQPLSFEEELSLSAHWTIMAQAQSTQEIQPLENGINKCAKILSFDLNQHPYRDEEEGASSSYADITASYIYA